MNKQRRPPGRRGGRAKGPRSVWWRVRRLSKLVAWLIVIMVAGSMVAYFALLLH